jgi:type I restriction enzyme S subunit
VTQSHVETRQMSLAELLDDGLFVDGDWVESKDQDPAGEVRLIQLADVGDGGFRDRSSRFLALSKAKELRCTFLEPGDVLVARMPDPLGRACIFPGVGRPAVTAVDVCILRPNPERARPEWLAKAINSPDFRASMQEFVRGTTRPRISRKNLGTLTLSVPSVEAQIGLARAVESIEMKRTSARTHLALGHRAIDRFRQSVIASAWSGGLLSGDTDAEVTELVTLETGLLDMKNGLSRRPSGHELGPIVLRLADVSDGHVGFDNPRRGVMSQAEIAKYRLSAGDLLFIRVNGSKDLVGRCIPFTGATEVTCFNDHLIRVRVNEDVFDPQYVALMANSWHGRTHLAGGAVSTAGQYTVNQTVLSQVPIPMRSLSVQREIIQRVDKLLALAKSIESRVGAANREVKRIQQAVLAKAFRGDLTVG